MYGPGLVRPDLSVTEREGPIGDGIAGGDAGATSVVDFCMTAGGGAISVAGSTSVAAGARTCSVGDAASGIGITTAGDSTITGADIGAAGASG